MSTNEGSARSQDDRLRVCILSGRNARVQLRHAVRADAVRAVCGTKPGRTVGWETVSALVTCPRCLHRLAAPGSNPQQWGVRKRMEARP